VGLRIRTYGRKIFGRNIWREDAVGPACADPIRAGEGKAIVVRGMKKMAVFPIPVTFRRLAHTGAWGIV
jgi:hypothetical protein